MNYILPNLRTRYSLTIAGFFFLVVLFGVSQHVHSMTRTGNTLCYPDGCLDFSIDPNPTLWADAYASSASNSAEQIALKTYTDALREGGVSAYRTDQLGRPIQVSCYNGNGFLVTYLSPTPGTPSTDPASAVNCSPHYECAGQTVIAVDKTCKRSSITTCSPPFFCSTGSSTCLVPPLGFAGFITTPDDAGAAGSGGSGARTSSGAGITMSGHLTALPALVRLGSPTHLFWNVTNAASCTVTSAQFPSLSLAGIASPTSGIVSPPIVSSTTFTLHCVGITGSSPAGVLESVVVGIIPRFQEQ